MSLAAGTAAYAPAALAEHGGRGGGHFGVYRGGGSVRPEAPRFQARGGGWEGRGWSHGGRWERGGWDRGSRYTVRSWGPARIGHRYWRPGFGWTFGFGVIAPPVGVAPSYYCGPADAYYPDVLNCPVPWTVVSNGY